MLLCIDIGNTNIKLGLFNGEKMVKRWRISTDRTNLADEYAMLLLNLFSSDGIDIGKLSGCAISSVVPALAQVFDEITRRYLNLEPIIISAETRTGMRINTEYPAEVGPDLIMNAYAARHLFGAPVIVVGFGTATSFSAVSAQGDFEGVSIAPGIVASAEALFRSAAALPQVALKRPQAAIGKNTIKSLQSGLVFGFAALVDGVVTRMKNELGGEARVVATGGLAELIVPETTIIETIEPNLALIGLRLVYELNKKG
jgi:type III pantothenate kinase